MSNFELQFERGQHATRYGFLFDISEIRINKKLKNINAYPRRLFFSAKFQSQ